MTALKCGIFKKNNVFEKTEMIKFRVAGSEDLKADLTEHASWDGSTKVASLLIHLDGDGVLTQMQPCLFGEADAKYLDATNIWENQTEARGRCSRWGQSIWGSSSSGEAWCLTGWRAPRSTGTSSCPS